MNAMVIPARKEDPDRDRKDTGQDCRKADLPEPE